MSFVKQRFFESRQRTPATPRWLPFSFIKSLPSIPATKTIRGTFALSCWSFDGFCLRLHHKMHQLMCCINASLSTFLALMITCVSFLFALYLLINFFFFFLSMSIPLFSIILTTTIDQHIHHGLRCLLATLVEKEPVLGSLETMKIKQSMTMKQHISCISKMNCSLSSFDGRHICFNWCYTPFIFKPLQFY